MRQVGWRSKGGLGVKDRQGGGTRGPDVKLIQSLGVGHKVSSPASSRKNLSPSLLIHHGVIEYLLCSRHCAGFKVHSVSRKHPIPALVESDEADKFVKQMSKQTRGEIGDLKERTCLFRNR